MISVKFNTKAVQGMTLEVFKKTFSHLKGVDLEKEYKALNPLKDKAKLSPTIDEKQSEGK